jgi:hypothetical protein
VKFIAGIILALAVSGSFAHTVAAENGAVPLVTVSGPSPFVICAQPNLATRNTNAETEPRLAVNPATVGTGHLNLIGVWIQDSQLGDVAASSSDGGASWAEVPLPFTRCAPAGLPYDRALDPWISIGPDGTAYATGVALSPGAAGTATAVVAASSNDGGRSWINAAIIQKAPRGGAPNDVVDKPTVTADPRKRGVAYAVWQTQRADGSSPPVGWMAKTTNGGRTWSRPGVIVPGVHGSGAYYHEIVADPRSGALYDIFNLIRPQMTYRRVCKKTKHGRVCKRVGTPVPGKFDGFVAEVKSGNRGKTWSRPQIIAEDQSLGFTLIPAGQVTTGPGIDATVDPRTGRIYVVWTDARFTGLTYDEVVIASSDDGGAHWSQPLSVSHAAASFNPAVAVNSNGTVAVTYDDLRDVSAGSPSRIDHWLTSSGDGGATFGGETLLGAFDIASAPYIQGFFVGDYDGLTAAGSTFFPFFILTTGQPADPTDVYCAGVSVSGS